jgi:L-asparaginase
MGGEPSSPRILLVATGGTIATAPSDAGLNEVRAGATELSRELAEVVGADLATADIVRLPSPDVTPDHMRQVAEYIDGARATGCEGVIVTHGTDTIEETAYGLSLMLERRIPIALTGSMRLPDEPGADGGANLLAALRVALAREVATLGPLVVIQDEIHLARCVSKVHTSRVAAFASPGFGPVGSVIEGKVRLDIAELPFTDYVGRPHRLDAAVELLWMVTGPNPRMIEVAAGASDGLVVAGTGGGHVASALVEPLRRVIKEGLPVVLASRTGSGPILEESYGGAGSEAVLKEIGVIPAGRLSPLKARLRLMVALSLGLDPRSVFPV